MEPSFSVVMTVYDNARELEQNLPAYLGQDYGPGYEVIVVDESSTDDTDDVLTRFKVAATEEPSATPRLYTTFLPRPNRRVSRQRMALTLGVKAAIKREQRQRLRVGERSSGMACLEPAECEQTRPKVKAANNEWIVFTNIHTAPSTTWLSELAEFATANTALMLGYIRKNGNVRLQLFDDIDKAHFIVGKAERRHANGHKGRLLRRLRGKYDFVVVRTPLGHDLLRHYELDVRGNKLLGYRLHTMFYNLFH